MQEDYIMTDCIQKEICNLTSNTIVKNLKRTNKNAIWAIQKFRDDLIFLDGVKDLPQPLESIIKSITTNGLRATKYMSYMYFSMGVSALITVCFIGGFFSLLNSNTTLEQRITHLEKTQNTYTVDSPDIWK